MPSTTTRPAWAPPPPPAGGPLAFDFGSGNAPTHPSGNGRPPSPRTIELGNLPVAVPPEKVLQPSAAGRPAASPLATLVYQALYLLGGFAMVISTQYLHYEGAADQRSMLPVMANYVGMVLVALFPGGRGSTPEDIGVTTRRVPQSVFVAQRALLWISLLDLLGYVFVTLAIFYIGSGLFQVIYASIVVMNALLARIFLNRKLTAPQWVAVVAVTFALAFSVMGAADSVEDANNTGGDYMSAYLGVAFALAGTALNAATYVLGERLLLATPMSPEATSFYVGAYCCFVCGIYLVVYTLPNWDTLVTHSIDAHAGRIGRIWLGYLVLIASSAVHSYYYFVVLRTTGSVSTGILHSVRAVMVFAVSALLFCSADEMQCYTQGKGIATVLVTAGVAGYVWASRMPS